MCGGDLCALLLFLFIPQSHSLKLTVKRRPPVLSVDGCAVCALCALAHEELLLTSHRPDDDARPGGLPSRPDARGAATVALVFLLRALDLPILKLPLVEVERCQGNEDDPDEHGHQHKKCQRGGERRKKAELLCAGAVTGLEPSVTAVHRHPRGLHGSRRHPVRLLPDQSCLSEPGTLRCLRAQRGDTGPRMWLPAPKRRHMRPAHSKKKEKKKNHIIHHQAIELNQGEGVLRTISVTIKPAKAQTHSLIRR